MTFYADMDVVELRHEYTAALEEACEYIRQFMQSYERGDEAGMLQYFGAFKAADSKVRQLKRHLRVEAA